MAYNIKIEAFEGPFDLLFHLIEKNELDLYDIPINEVTDQYIQYIKAMEELDLDLTSEFLVMAATLLEIKSKMLLPVEVVESQQLEFEELDPRNELVRKLLEYKKYKIAAEFFKEKEDLSRRLYFKPREEFIFEPEDKSGILENIEMSDLMKALERVLSEKPHRHSVQNSFRQMQRDAFTIEDKINELMEHLSIKPVLHFNRLFSELQSKNEVITTFLALLELIRLKRITVRQDLCFTDILIQMKNTNELEVHNHGRGTNEISN